MKTFAYYEPVEVEEACGILAEKGDGGKILAGGTALVNLLRLRLVAPAYVMSVHRLGSLRYLERDADGGLRIGALTTHREVERSELARRHFPMLSELEANVGSIQIRNRATVGGSLAHAEPAGDLAPGLIAWRAEVTVVSRSGRRTVPVEELVVDYYETVLQPDEILAEIRLPPAAPRTGSAFVKFWTRTPSDFAVVNVGCVMALDAAGACRDVSLGLGGVDARAIRPRRTEGLIRGQRLSERLVEEAGRVAAEECRPVSDLKGSADYKREMVRVFVPRALRAAAARAAGEGS